MLRSRAASLFQMYCFEPSWKPFIWNFIRSPSDSEKTLLDKILESLFPAARFPKPLSLLPWQSPDGHQINIIPAVPASWQVGASMAQCQGTPAGAYSWSAEMAPTLGYIKGACLSGVEARLLVHTMESHVLWKKGSH